MAPVKIKFFTIPIIFLSTFLFGQHTGKAIYTSSSQIELGLFQKNKTPTESNQLKKNNSLVYSLVFNDSLAFYYRSSNSTNKIEDIGTGYLGPNYFNFKDKTILRQKGKYLVSKKFEDFNWNLKNDESIINGFHCHKAETNLIYQGRKREKTMPVIAWYTLDICIAGGPNGFGGLPGLIISLEFDKTTTILHSLEWNIDNNILIPKNKIELSEAEYKQKIEETIQKIGSN